ncbi:hypothetical protein J6590_086693 [Homalodisca vitripennis]|nr:hypothetical protein J6590_086693 [Homalodisca vitripennis]
MKSFDASNVPPCKAELLQQFSRANYIASVWNNAHMKLPSIVTPENCGWTLEDNQYQFHWFDGDQLPSFVSESLQTEEDELSNDMDNDEDDDNADFSTQFNDWHNDEDENSNDSESEY